jgi:hypothetical protein
VLIELHHLLPGILNLNLLSGHLGYRESWEGVEADQGDEDIAGI